MASHWFYLGLIIIVSAYFMTLDECPFSLKARSMSVEEVIEKLENIAQNDSPIDLHNAAVGYNTNLDLACNGARLLNTLGVDPSGLGELRPAESISSLEDFGRSFGHFFQKGSAAERAAKTSEIWETITQPLKANNFADCHVLPGGNAALISNRLSALSVSVLLGGPVGTVLENLLDPSIITMRKFHEQHASEDAIPEISDEIHLIMEFSTGEQWGSIVSPRANRFIISHDLQNSHLSVMEDFHHAITEYGPQVVIIAGSHLLESLTIAERSSRLQDLVNSLSSVPSHTAIHLEIAGVGDVSFLEEMARNLFPLVDSIGLNEQELGMLYLATGGTVYTDSDFVSPSAQTAAEAIQYLMDLEYVKTGKGAHEVNRVHLHYLSFHMIGQRISPSVGVFKWDKDKAARAVAAGSLATSTQACGENGELPGASELHVKDYGTEDLFSHFETSSMEFWVAPVAVCNVPKRTVGLGDCISATGIAYHF